MLILQRTWHSWLYRNDGYWGEIKIHRHPMTGRFAHPDDPKSCEILNLAEGRLELAEGFINLPDEWFLGINQRMNVVKGREQVWYYVLNDIGWQHVKQIVQCNWKEYERKPKSFEEYAEFVEHCINHRRKVIERRKQKALVNV